MIVLLSLAMVAAPFECARIASDESRDPLSGATPARALVQLAETCAYADSGDFQVGDKVRIYKPEARVHNSVAVVGCPGTNAATEGRVCLAEAGGCYSVGHLRHMSAVDLALVNLYSRANEFAVACAGQAAGYWPVVQEKLATFAHITREKMGDAGSQFFAATNVCDPIVRSKVHATFAVIQSHIASMASFAAGRWPYVQAKLASTAEMTAAGVAKLGKVFAKVLPRGAAKASDKLELEKMLASLTASVEQLASGAIDQSPKLALVVENVGAFADLVGQLSGKISLLAVDAYNNDLVQEGLAMVQAGAGRLIAAAADKWPDVKMAVADLAGRTASRIGELGLQAFEEVNLCNPQKREQVQAAFAAAKSRVDDLANAVAEHWPTVKSGLMDLAESMSATLRTLAEKLAASIEDLGEREEVQEALEYIRVEVAQLQDMVADKAASGKAQAQEYAMRIEEQVRALVKRVTKGESAGLDDDLDIAEL